MALSMELRGLDGVLKMLDRVEAGLRGEIRQQALMAGGLIVEARAKQLVPKVTGNLARSIHTEADDNEARVGTDVVYARRIEYGFSGTDSLGRRYNQPAQPYLRPALDGQQSEIVATMTQVLRTQIEAAAR